MTIAVIVVCALSVALFTWITLRGRRGAVPESATLAVCPVLSSDAQVLHRRLLKALPQYVVLSQVRLDNFVEGRRRRLVGHADAHREFNQECVDFLICDNDYLPVAAVELEDVLERPRPRDRACRVLQRVNIPLLRWDTVNLPDTRTIQEAVAEVEALRVIGQSRRESARQGRARTDGLRGRPVRREPRL